jgi:predicted phage-related endonuclease
MTHNQRLRYFFDDQHSPGWNLIHDPKNRPLIIGASVAPNILGVGYISSAKQFNLYMGIVKRQENNCAMDYGNVFEPEAIKGFYEHFPQFIGIRTGMILHPKCEFVGATPDQILIHKTRGMYNMEVKCPFNQKVAEIAQFPYKYIVQVQIQMACIGVKETIFLIWTPEKAVVYLVPFHQELHDHIMVKLAEFKKMIDVGLKPGKARQDPAFILMLEQVRSNITFVKGDF